MSPPATLAMTIHSVATMARAAHEPPGGDARAQGHEEQQDGDHPEPDEGVRAGRRQGGEGHDAGHGPHDVRGIGAQRRQALEQRPQGQGEGRHQARHEEEHEGQDEEVDVGRGALRQPEEELVGGPDLHVQLGLVDQQHHAEEQQGEGRQRQPAAVAAGDDAQADAQEAAHQHEVGEEADVDDFRRDPADEQQLDEEQGAAGQEQAHAHVGQAGQGRQELGHVARAARRSRAARFDRRLHPGIIDGNGGRRVAQATRRGRRPVPARRSSSGVRGTAERPRRRGRQGRRPADGAATRAPGGPSCGPG